MSDDAPLTSRSPARQMQERPANFPTAGEALGASTQDVHEPADAGKGAPPSHNRAFAFVLRDRIADLRVDAIPTVDRAVLLVIATYARPDGTNAWPSIAELRRVTGHSTSRIVDAIRELARRGWIQCHERYDLKTRARTSTGYTVSLSGELWPESEARAKRRATVKLPPGGRTSPLAPGAQGTPPSACGAEPPLRAAQSPLAPGAEPPCAGRNRSTHDQPSNNPSDQPPIAPAQARARDPLQPDQALLFRPSEPAGVTPIPGSRTRVKKPAELKPAKATDGYADAWVDGNADAGARISRPTAAQVASIGRAAAAHARYRDGEAITGAELQRWIRVKARKFREQVEDPAKQRGGMTPYGFLLWLDDDPDTRAIPWRRPEEREREAAAARLPPPPAEQRPEYTPEQAALAKRFQSMLRGEGPRVGAVIDG